MGHALLRSRALTVHDGLVLAADDLRAMLMSASAVCPKEKGPHLAVGREGSKFFTEVGVEVLPGRPPYAPCGSRCDLLNRTR
jgi:hypothetical protein